MSDDTDDQDLIDDVASDTTSTGGKLASGIRSFVGRIAWAFAVNILQFFYHITRFGPGSGFWKKLSQWGLYKYHRATGGDRLGLEFRPNGKVEPIPVKWKPPELCEEDEKPGWRAKGRDRAWTPTTEGADGHRLGKVPIVPLDSDNWRASSVMEARVAEAVDQGYTRPLYRVDEAELEATINYGAAAGGQAVADGGANVERVFQPQHSPVFEDMIIDLNGEDGYDGSAISFNKVRELMLETTTTDEMKAQEQRGFLAGRSGQDVKKLAFKLFLAAIVFLLLFELGPVLIENVLGGGGGGGGGGLIPLTADAVATTWWG